MLKKDTSDHGQADSSGKPGEALWKASVPDLQRIAATEVK